MGFVDEIFNAYVKVKEKDHESERNKVASNLIIDHMSEMLGGHFFTQASPTRYPVPEVHPNTNNDAPLLCKHGKSKNFKF